MATFYKLSGTGNTFLLTDLRSRGESPNEAVPYKGTAASLMQNGDIPLLRSLSLPKRKVMTREICNTYEGVGADGLIFLEDSEQADLKWDFYNADGTRAEMCGNAARCVAKFVLDSKVSSGLGSKGTSDTMKNDTSSRTNAASSFAFKSTLSSAKGGAITPTPPSVSIETQAGVVIVSLHETRKSSAAPLFDVLMPEVREYRPKCAFKISNQTLTFDFVNTGVPHAVVKVKHLKSLTEMQNNVDKLEDIVNKIRSLTQFKKSGTNVTFYSKVTSSSKTSLNINSLTFERGIRGYTMACGTGAVAAAYCASYNRDNGSHHRRPLTVKVHVPGGLLQVSLPTNNGRPHLLGPARWIAAIDWRPLHQFLIRSQDKKPITQNKRKQN